MTDITKYHFGFGPNKMSNKSCIQTDFTDALSDLSPSEKLVFKTFQYTGELTQKELAEETRLSSRTARYATRTLEEHGIVASRICFQDARQRLYSLTAPFQTDETDQS